MNLSITNRGILPRPKATVRLMPATEAKLSAWKFRIAVAGRKTQILVLNGSLPYAEAVAIAANHFRKDYGDLEFIDL
jgi:hypothetical protein